MSFRDGYDRGYDGGQGPATPPSPREDLLARLILFLLLLAACGSIAYLVLS